MTHLTFVQLSEPDQTGMVFGQIRDGARVFGHALVTEEALAEFRTELRGTPYSDRSRLPDPVRTAPEPDLAPKHRSAPADEEDGASYRYRVHLFGPDLVSGCEDCDPDHDRWCSEGWRLREAACLEAGIPCRLPEFMAEPHLRREGAA